MKSSQPLYRTDAAAVLECAARTKLKNASLRHLACVGQTPGNFGQHCRSGNVVSGLHGRLIRREASCDERKPRLPELHIASHGLLDEARQGFALAQQVFSGLAQFWRYANGRDGGSFHGQPLCVTFVMQIVPYPVQGFKPAAGAQSAESPAASSGWRERA